MQINEYQDLTGKTEIVGEAADIFLKAPAETQHDWLQFSYYTGKLNGEAGEVAEIVFKAFRDEGGYMSPERLKALEKELGDVLWYVARIANQAGLDLERVMQANIDKLMSRKERGVLGGSGNER